MYLQALSKDTCKLIMMVNGDPHLTGVPSNIVNFTVKNMIGAFLKNIRETAKNLPEEYFERIRTKRDYYEKIEEVLANIKV